jgi:hypothetical protein
MRLNYIRPNAIHDIAFIDQTPIGPAVRVDEESRPLTSSVSSS